MALWKGFNGAKRNMSKSAIIIRIEVKHIKNKEADINPHEDMNHSKKTYQPTPLEGIRIEL